VKVLYNGSFEHDTTGTIVSDTGGTFGVILSASFNKHGMVQYIYFVWAYMAGIFIHSPVHIKTK